MSDERQLATIVRIESLEPIEGADTIELAKMVAKGWQVVVKKGEFKPGDLAVYFEIDSFLPVSTKFEFLRKSCYREMDGVPGFRLKTIKLRGALSQGLLMPSNIITKLEYLHEGIDLTEYLGVLKYEPKIPSSISGEAKGNFPSWIPKTDEERIQNFHSKNNSKIDATVFYVTEKLEGSSFSAYANRYENADERGGVFGVCSRNLELHESDSSVYWQVAKDLRLEERMRRYMQNHPEVFNIALQGELVGPGVQKNIYGLPKKTVYFFGALINGRKLDFNALRELLDHGLDTIEGTRLEDQWLDMVPLVHVPLTLTGKTTDEIIAMADGKSALNPNQDREGLVFRALDGSISFKAISNRYLLGDKS